MQHEPLHPDSQAPAYPNLLVLELPIPNGKRLVAAVNFCEQSCHWRLLRNGNVLRESSSATLYDTAVIFELKEPILPGDYRVELVMHSKGV